jgi:predicted CXXCH cytochrome family protein
MEGQLSKKQLLHIGVTSIILFFASINTASASDSTQENQLIVANDYCLSCHDAPGLRTTMPSGEELYIAVDSETYNASTHGSLGYACVQCHTDKHEYPHPEKTAQTLREYSLQRYKSCQKCHSGNYEETLDSTHQKALNEGNTAAAICTDCHGIHNIGLNTQTKSSIPNICERCHSEIFNLYKQSAHGSALINVSNPDVPTCIDCHGVHNVSGPSTENSFHLFSPTICANCHENEVMMEKYKISTNVFDTYISDFHGSTVVLFEKIAPDQETNKPVCIDCHGVHDMREVDDPESMVMKDNLLETCQKCHPDATSNFPTSWLGHYEPSSEEAPLIFFVDLFYKILIPVTLGGMFIFVSSDIWNKIHNKWENRK